MDLAANKLFFANITLNSFFIHMSLLLIEIKFCKFKRGLFPVYNKRTYAYNIVYCLATKSLNENISVCSWRLFKYDYNIGWRKDAKDRYTMFQYTRVQIICKFFKRLKPVTSNMFYFNCLVRVSYVKFSFGIYLQHEWSIQGWSVVFAYE